MVETTGLSTSTEFLPSTPLGIGSSAMLMMSCSRVVPLLITQEFVVFFCQIVRTILVFGSMVAIEDASKDPLVMILILTTYPCDHEGARDLY